MAKTENKSAVLVFIRTSKDEISNKRFLNSGRLKNQNFLKVLNNRAIATAKQSGLPYFIVNSNQQIGGDFCQKFKNAFQVIFNKGYDNVISIGNDSPNLTAKDLLLQAQELENNTVTFGTTNKDGLYTFGLTKDAFKRINFSKINWQAKNLITSLQEELAHKNLNYTCLKSKYIELNSEKDVYCFLTAIRNIKELKLEFSLLLNFIVNAVYLDKTWVKVLHIQFLKELKFRGPPMHIA